MSTAYHEPHDLVEALAVLDEHPDARPVAGGTDLVVAARTGRRELPARLLAVHRLDELRGVAVADGTLRLGALATHDEVETSPPVREQWPALADASALVGSPATRNAGTVGGNLANGSPAMELGAPLLVHGATIELASKGGGRHLDVGELLRGPGVTAIGPGELVVAVHVASPPAGAASAYVRLEYRRAMEIAVVGAAALVALDDAGHVTDARLALTAVAPTCVVVDGVADAMRGRLPDDGTLAAASALAGATARPIDDARAPAAYRRAMTEVIARRALVAAAARARGEEVPVPATRWRGDG